MNSRAFQHEATAGRVLFGPGSRHSLADEADRLGATRIMIIASAPEDALADEAVGILGDRVVGRFANVVQHVPDEQASEAVEHARGLRVDTIVTIGGGSATGFGKVARLELNVAFIAVPTTYAGSEMTTIWGRTFGDDKRTGKDPRVKPDTVIYDPELTLSLPASIAAPSGMNALAHSVEALYGPGANPIVNLYAYESIRALAAGLPGICAADSDIRARSDVLYGAHLAGLALASGGIGLHHKTCHVLGGMFDLNHGGMNAVVLGHALEYNAPALPDVMPGIGDALGCPPEKCPAALHDLAATIGAPTSLEAIGMPADGLDEAARRTVEHAADNVRPPEYDGIHTMLANAFHGRRPGGIS